MENLDQLSSLLSPILNDPEAMAGIAKAAEEMGLGGLLGGNLPNGNDNSAGFSPPPAAEASPAASAFPDGFTSVLGQIMPLLSGGGKDDNTTRLLCALRPFLHGERAKRLDDAERVVKLLSVVTLLRERGIL